MKLILSRKAFDSGAGKVANPILEDGSLIPMPIPDKQSPIRYQDITIAGQNLGTVASDLTNGRTRADHFAHLDPDLIESAYPREPGWRPLFGQVGAAQSVLAREGVGPGDLFLFFGWFRRATSTGGRFRFVPGAPDLHVIWGWMQVDEVVPVGSVEHPAWMEYHPHIASPRGRGNTVYTAREKLTLDGSRTRPSRRGRLRSLRRSAPADEDRAAVAPSGTCHHGLLRIPRGHRLATTTGRIAGSSTAIESNFRACARSGVRPRHQPVSGSLRLASRTA